MEKFQGKTVADMFSFNSHEDVNKKPILFPKYPRYTDEELRKTPEHEQYITFHENPYLDYISSRFAYFGKGMTTIMPENIVTPDQLPNYWESFFKEHFPIGEILQYKEQEEYKETIQKLLKENPERKVVGLQPYIDSHIPLESHYLDPDILFTLNNKGNMYELTDSSLPYDTFTAEEFQNDTWRERWRLPFVVKINTASGGGEGVRICKNEGDILWAKHSFKGQEVKIESFVDGIVANYNVQICVDKEGGATLVGGSEQKVDESGKYGGNHITYDWRPSPKLEKIIQDICNKAHELGWHGVCGLDFFEDNNEEFFFIDPNFRLNASTPFYLIKEYITDGMSNPVLESGSFQYPGKPEELLGRIKNQILNKIIIPVSLYYDPAKEITKMVGAVVSEGNADRIPHLIDAFRSRFGLHSL